MRYRLALGKDPVWATAQIRELAGTTSTAIRTVAQTPVDQRDDYVRWATNMEAHLGAILRREDAEAFFANPRHQAIYSMAAGNHLITLINTELEAKRRDLEAMADWLATHLVRMQGAGSPLVVDTNVLLQCQRLDSVNWTNVIEGGARVMIPLRVLEEIDTKKQSDSKRLRQIARGLLPWIDELFGSGAGPVELAPSATVELLLAERPRYKPSDADEEILDVAHDVLQFAGSVLLMTGDTGMRVRATTEGLDVLRLPDAWRRKTDDDPA